jgi:iron-sulfur cluster insertion protein
LGKNSLTEIKDALAQQALFLGMRKQPVFTEAIALKVKELIEEEGKPNLMLRVFVSDDGCSRFQYGFTFDEAIQEGDAEIRKEGVKFLIDPISFQYLTGAQIDYTEGLEGSQFVVRNPNATTPSTTN